MKMYKSFCFNYFCDKYKPEILKEKAMLVFILSLLISLVIFDKTSITNEIFSSELHIYEMFTKE